MPSNIQSKPDLALFHQVVENSPVPTMLADLDLNITYLNSISKKTLAKVEQYLPCRVDEIVGKCIDFFHANPAHQRGILGNPANLPHRADIQLGPEKLDLLISPLLDEDGKDAGLMVTWDLVTERRALEFEQAKMHAMIENSPVNIMLADLDGTITYVNPATRKNLEPIAQHLPVPVDKLQGSCIDIFHKVPSHQRGILSDPKNLPHRADIQVGSETLDLMASAIFDAEGAYIGPMVTWENITEKLRLEERTREQTREAEERAQELQTKVDSLLNNVEAAAAGDLSTVIEVRGEDAVGKLGEGIESMMANLRQLISQIADSADKFGEGAQVISEGATSLSDGAQTQNATVEEMSAAIHNLNEMINEVANNARSADEIARMTSKNAEDGGVAVEKNVQAMKLIDKSSQQISEIIGVISEIASQTNLLALNAAIEAARAGEHGLGFAVVADEVRKLAERSSAAAKEIASLIKESTSRVQEGAQLSEQTGEALKTIIGGVERSAESIGQIASATGEQATAAEEVSSGVKNVSSITESNASAAEEMAGSAEELTGQAQELRELVSRFKV